MAIKDEAREYAIRVVENEISRIEQAYLDGYNTAKAKYCNEAIVDEEYKTVTIEGKTSEPIEWIPLSLPSGTQWSKPLRYKCKKSDSEYYFNPMAGPYNRVKDLSLPTVEDVKELLKYTNKTRISKYYSYKDVDGRTFELYESEMFWLKQSEINSIDRYIFDGNLSIRDRFMGDNACIILVKHKE